MTVDYSSFSGTYDVVKLTHEGGSYSYTISGTRVGNMYQGTDFRDREFTFQLDDSGNLITGSYLDPDGGETGALTPEKAMPPMPWIPLLLLGN